MRASTVAAAFASLAVLAAGCNRGSSSGNVAASSASTTNPQTQTTQQTTTVPSPSPSPVASPSPSPSPSPTGSSWLHVASQATDKITTFALDPATGAPSNPTDTSLIGGLVPGASVFHVNGLAVDPTSTILFAAGDLTAATFPPRTHSAILPIALSNGTLTPGSYLGGGAASSGAVVVSPNANVVFTVDTAQPGAVTPGATNPAGGLSAFVYAPGTGAPAPGISTLFGSSGPPAAAVINPTGTFLFAVDPTDATLSAFGVDSGGFVAGTNPPVVTTSSGPRSIAMSPFGNMLVTGHLDGTVTIWSVSPAGVATAILPGTSVEPAGYTGAPPEIESCAIDPTGSWLVTANGVTGDVSLLALANAPPTATGPLVGAPYVYPNGPALLVSVVWNANGSVVYVANASGSTILGLSVTAQGLAALPGSPFSLPAGDQSPVSVVVSQ